MTGPSPGRRAPLLVGLALLTVLGASVSAAVAGVAGPAQVAAVAPSLAPPVPAPPAAAAVVAPAPVEAPRPPPLSTDGPPAAQLAAARAAAAGDVGTAAPPLRSLPVPGYAALPAGASWVAPLTAPLRVSPAAGVAPATTLASPTDKGAPLRLLVLGRAVDATGAAWTHVAMERRPNGTTGWVRAADVTEATDPWRITVLQGRHRVLVWYGASLLADQPVAVGAAATPTPVGVTYVDVLVDTGNPYGAYGQWILGLASHSDAYDTFGGGDALIALHGTDEPDSIGHSVSHGCVRMQRPLAALLAHLVPLGTRVDIRA